MSSNWKNLTNKRGILNRQHPLYRLADSIDWSFFDREFGNLYVENFGRPDLPIRLFV